MFSKLKSKFAIQISDDFQRKRQQLIILLFVLGTISAIMSVLNVLTNQNTLLVATTVFCGFSYISALIGICDKHSMRLTSLMFIFEIFMLFTYFIINGGTEGFSTIWLLLLPACGLFAFGKKEGSALTGVLFAEILFFFYTPI